MKGQPNTAMYIACTTLSPSDADVTPCVVDCPSPFGPNTCVRMYVCNTLSYGSWSAVWMCCAVVHYFIVCSTVLRITDLAQTMVLHVPTCLRICLQVVQVVDVCLWGHSHIC